MLKKETLEPAKMEAAALLVDAQKQAELILQEANQQAKTIIENARLAIEQERHVFHSSLEQSSKLSLEALKQLVEKKLFNETIQRLTAQEFSAPKIIAKLVEAIVLGIKKEGISQDFTVMIPKNCSAEDVSRHLAANVLQELEKNPICVGSFEGGVQVKLEDKQLKLVITAEELSQYLKRYVRKDFRKYIFSSEG